MKQKIVIKVVLDCDKCRSKALKIAAVAKGVRSVSVEGGEGDRVVVVGEGVDSVSLAKVLRRKFRHASIVSVEELRDEERREKEKSREDCSNRVPLYCYDQLTSSSSYQLIYDPYPSNCTIL